MSGPSVRIRLPPLSLFKFPPDNDPQTLTPPRSWYTFASPFPISERIFNGALEPYVPITIASIYLVTALWLNKQNRKSGGKPWAISKTRGFFIFVLAHNIFLALYSAATFAALLRSLRHTWPSHREYPWLGILWPGLRTQNGLAGAVDALCKPHGPRGLGDAATYSAVRGAWAVKNKLIKLAPNGLPDPTDVGRFWNEGLAFWGWWFYISKFYEVLDTLIILMKGKRTSTLQVYHHMGAMLAMWSGIRYMSTPIWMFTWVNSGIHALMYVYYALSALNVRVPRRLKKTLTTMQITQFLVGITFASSHLFFEYSVPASTIYAGTQVLKTASSNLASAYSTVSSEAVAATSTVAFDAWLKKLAYRAAGQEGLAGNVRNQHGEVFGPGADTIQAQVKRFNSNTIPQYEWVHCIDTTGQAFAIWFNVIYLAPLTWLFLRFFFRSYKRDNTKNSKIVVQNPLAKSVEEAALKSEQKLDQAGKKVEDGVDRIAEEIKQATNDQASNSGILSDGSEVLSQNGDATTQKSPKKKNKKKNKDKDSAASNAPTLKGESTNTSQDSTVLVDKDDALSSANGNKENGKPEGLSSDDSKANGAPSYADKVK